MMTNLTREQRIEKALDTLAELCDVQNPNDDQYGRRSAAEEILRHYREEDMREKGINVNLTVNGAVPVWTMTRVEVEEAQR